MATTVLRVDSAVAEVQAVGIASRRERRPAEPVAADAKQCTVALGASGVAEARGRAASLFLEATQLKTVRMVTTVLRVDSAEVKVQAVGNASRGERRPAEPIATDVTQRTGAVTAAARGRGRSALESWSWLGNKLKLPLRRAGGASRHSALAIRARKQSLSARRGNPV